MVKFRTTWNLMEKKSQCVEHIDPKAPSLTEKCPPFNIAKLLQCMTKQDAMQILGFAGFPDTDVGEEILLDDATAFDDAGSDAIDRFEELCQNVVEQASTKEKLSAGERHTTHSQADTTLTAESGTKTQSPSKSDDFVVE